jgi:hypothetical protein
MKPTMKKIYLIAAFLLLLPVSSFAQDEDFPDDVDDQPTPLPINIPMVPALVAGCAAGYFLLRKRDLSNS